MGKFWKWFSGVAATVVSGVAIWYFTKTTPPPPPPPPPAVTTFEGMVYTGDLAVPNAMVAVTLTGDAGANGPVHNVTDTHGSYLISLTGVPQGTGATLSVAAAGFRDAAPQSLAIPLQSDNRLDVALTPVAGLTPLGSVGPKAGQPAGHAEAGHAPAYIRKDLSQATQFKIEVKPK